MAEGIGNVERRRDSFDPFLRRFIGPAKNEDILQASTILDWYNETDKEVHRMKKEVRTVVYDDELQIEAYRFEGIVQPFRTIFMNTM